MFLAIDAASLIWFCALFKDESKNSVSSGHGSQLKSQKKEEDYSVDVNSEYTSSPAEFTAMSKFGWSLQDIVHDPSRTGLTNFRNKFRPRRRPPQPLPLSASSQLFHDDHEEVVGSNNELHYWNSEENLMLEMSNSAADLSRLKRQTSLSQVSDTSSSRRIHSSMSDSGYPSLTSTVSDESSENHHATTPTSTGVPGYFPAIGPGRTTLNGCGRMAPIASEASSSSESVDCWRGSVHHAMAVIEHRGEEIPSLFDQLHELKSDLTSMSRQVSDLNESVQDSAISYQRHRARPPLRSSNSVCGSRTQSIIGRSSRSSTPTGLLNRRRRCFDSCIDLHSLTEDEMASVVHRLLTRVCELSLSRQDANSRNEIPLII